MPTYSTNEIRTFSILIIAGLVSCSNPVYDKQIPLLSSGITCYENNSLNSILPYIAIGNEFYSYNSIFTEFISKIEDTPTEILNDLNERFWDILA